MQKRNKLQHLQCERQVENNLNIPVAMTIHIVKQFLVVFELIVPLVWNIVAEVVTKRHQQNVVLVQLSLLTVLIQQRLSSVTNNVLQQLCNTIYHREKENPS